MFPLHNESWRLHDLHRYQILDTPPEQAYDDLVKLAAQMCQVPIALISLVDRDRQWFKAKAGLDICETSREVAFCHHTIQHPEAILVVPDALQDPRFCENPLVTGEPNIRFYAGCSLVTPKGMAIGTLCIIDYQPRTLTQEQQEALGALSRQIVNLLEMRLALEAEQRLQQFKSQLITQISHEIRTPLGIISSSAGILDMYAPKLSDEARQKHHCRIQTAVSHLARLVDDAIALDALENGQIVPLVEACDIQEICTLLAQEIRLSYGRQINFLTIPEVGDVLLFTDRCLLSSLVSNILIYLVQHSAQDGCINLEIGTDGDSLVIRIEDPDVEMSPADLQAAFSTPAAAIAANVGLSLANSRRLAERMGWPMCLQNEASQGTSVCIHIPLGR
ncbi:MAG: GAF domain-containing protein [Leptolyngbyaceae cyanobacterium]